MNPKIEIEDKTLYEVASKLTKGKVHNYSSFQQFVESLKLFFICLIVTQKTMRKVVYKLSLQIENGLSVGAGINNLRKAYVHHLGSKHPISLMLSVLEMRYAQKSTITYAMSPFLDTKLMAIIQSGEGENGNLPKSMRLALETYRLKNELNLMIKKGLISPFFALISGVVTIGYCHYEVFPDFASSLTPEKLAASVGPLMDFTSLLVTLSPIIMIIGIACVVFIRWSLANQIIKRPSRIPPWSVVNAADSAINLLILSSLLSSGQKLIAALKIMEKNSNRYNAYWIKRIRLSASTGTSIGRALACDYFSKDARIDIESYADTNEFSELLSDVAMEVFETTRALVNNIVIIIGVLGFLVVMLYVMGLATSLMTM